MTEEQKRPYEVIAKKNKEKYVKEMEAYKQKKDEEAANLMKEEEEHMKLQKQEALQLLKKEKTENIIKKTKLNRQKKKQNKEDKNSDPNRPKRPPSSYILFSRDLPTSLLVQNLHRDCRLQGLTGHFMTYSQWWANVKPVIGSLLAFAI